MIDPVRTPTSVKDNRAPFKTFGRAKSQVVHLLALFRRREQPLVDGPPVLASASLHRLANAAPIGTLRTTLWTLLALVVSLLLWSLTTELDIVAVAHGKLVPISQVKVVQVAEAGIVREIRVRDGDHVVAGELLVRMDTTLTGADASQVAHELALKRISIRAIDATLSGRRLSAQDGEPSSAFLQVSAQFQAREQALNDAIAQERRAAARVRSERLAAQQIRDKLHVTLPIVRKSAESFGYLQRQGFVGDLMAAEKQKDLLALEQDLKAQEATLNALDAAIAQAEQRITLLRSNSRSQLLTERMEVQAAVDRLQQEHAKLGFRTTLLEVRAPQDGVVHKLATHTPGAVVQPGTALLQVVPKGDKLRCEAALANEDVGFAAVGQRVKVKLAAYPFQKYGVVEGTVVQLSADSQDPEVAAKATGSAHVTCPVSSDQ